MKDICQDSLSPDLDLNGISRIRRSGNYSVAMFGLFEVVVRRKKKKKENLQVSGCCRLDK
jgi:hypothetical protein